ncbi:MAG: NAD(P)-dependent oxidoreductase [Planctomycetota bacterium]|jgi:3-hydroxyisobutyrate dehydrogenase|nr:NAD(P)-dependent oxidoreductase [Planctomycetota bacterium]
MARILFIGIGKMGLPISMNLLRAGHELVVFDKNPAQTALAVGKGAVAATDLPAEAGAAEFIFTMLPASQHLVDVVMGEAGAARHMAAGRIWVDMSTVSVEASRRCNAAIDAAGGMFLRAAVNGSTLFAENAQLTVIASGRRAAYDRALPLLEKLSQTRFYLGDADQARLMKLAVNLVVHATIEVFAEAAVLCEKGGIDWNDAIDVFEGSSIASPQLKFKLPAIRKRDYDASSYAATIVKDSVMALEAAHELGVYAPASAAVLQVYEAGVARGDGGKDFAAVIRTIEAMSGLG